MAHVAFLGLCPQCGARTLFAGWVRFARTCPACGLDLSRFNVGDGPAGLLTLVVGAVVTGLAIWVQLAFDPPIWVHALLWIPLTFALVIAGLRVAKAWLLGMEYRWKAGEAGQRDTGP
ncbi:DUF983 domain-containing protein [Novosphingobium sp. 1949]|uniref:DUF983 domain-containing protein n=1 Tax=Novosphingobium organovorum TaxID=2930092 RepID=A0ABT0BDP0_9SPHN|nr:DUF983 domain-containing protein [Novosphingobium organovorum]MCJ2183163.1 DUF983 domain-containing protein [Novosphingobium organovorum]